MAVTSVTYTGNGVTQTYSLTFPYLERSDIKAQIDGTPTTAFTFDNDTTVRFTSPPANGAVIKLYRETDVTALKAEFFPGSAVRAQDLNEDFYQTLYVSQETQNNVNEAVAGQIPDGTITTAKIADETILNADISPNAEIDPSKLLFTQTGVGVQPRNVSDKLKDFVNILEFIPAAEHAAIKAKTSTYNCSAAIQNALTTAGRVYFPPGRYRVTQTVTISVAAGAADRPQLIGAGGNNSTTIIQFVPSVAGNPLFTHFHSADYEGIEFQGPGAATGTGEACFDFGNVGTQRHTRIQECMFRFWNKAALYFSGQWSITVDNCRFIDCGNSSSPAALTGGAVFDQTVVSGWSTSGMVFSNCYFSGCSYGYYAENAWNLTFINPIFEYCAYPYWRDAAGSAHTLINPWYESNANDPVSTGPVIVLGGRGVGWTGNNVTTSADSGSFHITGGGIVVYKGSTARATLRGSGNLAFADGYGIDFSAVAGGGASGSVLTDYETGNWTPVVSDGTNNATATVTTAIYTKTGNVVRIRAAILNINTAGLTAGNQLRITGLPYTTVATVNTWQHVPVTVADISSTAGTIVGQIRNSSSTILLNNETTTGLTNALVSQVTSGSGDIWLDFAYVA